MAFRFDVAGGAVILNGIGMQNVITEVDGHIATQRIDLALLFLLLRGDAYRLSFSGGDLDLAADRIAGGRGGLLGSKNGRTRLADN